MDYAGYVKSFYKYSVKYFGIAAVLNCRTGEQYSNDLCTHYVLQCKHLLYPVTVKKGTLHWFHSRDYYLIITQTSLFGIQNGKSCRSVMPGITVLPMGAVIWRTDYYPDTVRNGRLHCKCLQGFSLQVKLLVLSNSVLSEREIQEMFY